MDIVIESVKKLEGILEHSGCEETGVILYVDPDAVNCQYEKGACLTASFGGRSAEFVTRDPIRATTKISFMFGAPLDTPPVRSVACAIVNVATGFFCLSRVLHSCPESSHIPCYEQLKREIAEKRIYCIGDMSKIESVLGNFIVTDPNNADVILINGEGIIAEGTGALIENNNTSKRIICLGPSTAGVARLHQIEHWCPYGTC